MFTLCTDVFIHKCTLIFTYVSHMFTLVHTHVYTHTCIRTCVHSYLHTLKLMFKHMFTYKFAHVYTYSVTLQPASRRIVAACCLLRMRSMLYYSLHQIYGQSYSILCIVCCLLVSVPSLGLGQSHVVAALSDPVPRRKNQRPTFPPS